MLTRRSRRSRRKCRLVFLLLVNDDTARVAKSKEAAAVAAVEKDPAGGLALLSSNESWTAMCTRLTRKTKPAAMAAYHHCASAGQQVEQQQ